MAPQQGDQDMSQKGIIAGLERYGELAGLIKAMREGEFEDLRRRFAENLASETGAQERVARRGAEQEFRRRGMGDSGMLAATTADIGRGIETQRAKSLGEFEAQLLGAQQAEDRTLRRGMLDFLSMALGSFRSMEDQMVFAKFNEGIQQNAQSNSLWGEIGGALGQVGLAVATGGASVPAQAAAQMAGVGQYMVM